jgi:8-oxo-dGTP pyrophosphatase MutT (NUDIX family)
VTAAEGTTAKPYSCGVIVTDGRLILLGHATRTPRWDIPKGVAEPGEGFVAAAQRELGEETGLSVDAAALVPLGLYSYRRDKGLALFLWVPPALPDPKLLHCASCFPARDGAMLPEFDRFGLFSRDEAVRRVGKAMAEILARISLDPLKGASSGAA